MIPIKTARACVVRGTVTVCIEASCVPVELVLAIREARAQ
jgi:hypothetical protein